MTRTASPPPPPNRLARAGRLLLLALPAAGCSDFLIHGEDPVVADTVAVTEEFVQTEPSAVDILWVVDDTPSMAAEQAALADAIEGFAEGLLDLGAAWQVGVVSTDISGEDAGVLRGNPWIITPAADDPTAALADAALVGTDGAEPAGGLGAAWLALTEPLASGANLGFRRPEAALHVIVYADGDDASEPVLGDDPAGAFLDFLADEAAASGQPAILSAIVGDSPSGCVGSGGTAVAGERYLAVAEGSGGATASVCDPDFAVLMDALASISAPFPDTFPLSAVPEPGTVRVSVDGERLDGGWSLSEDPPAVVFDEPPPAGAVIEVRYEVPA